MNSNDIQSPFPLIHVDLNRNPNPSPDFFSPNHLDQPSSLVSSHAVITGCMLFPQPRPHQDHHPHQDDLVDELIIAQGGPHDHLPSDLIEGNKNLSDHDRHHEYCSVKWMSSKMRIMKKMTGGSSGKPSAVQKFEPDLKHEAVPPAISDRDSNSNRSSTSGIEANNNNPTIIRACADCNTTKTPLWRSGPRGPKSLCNACGIRQRKARRAMALAAVAANGEPPPYPIPAPTQKAAKLKQHKKMMKKKRPSLSNNDHGEESDVQPKKKRKGKIVVHTPADPRKLCFEEFRLRLSERISGFQGVFPQDEKEAAILLMALSYGLVQS